MLVRLLLLLAASGCGRIGFDETAGVGVCEGTTCGVQCTTNCFPMQLYSGQPSPLLSGMAAAALPTGEVHLLYIDPGTGGVMWMYSDDTLRNWSVPIDLGAGAEPAFGAVGLVLHADASLTALMLDVGATTTTLYRRSLAPSRPGVWAPGPALATLPLPATTLPIYGFSVVADHAGTGGAIALNSEGEDTIANAVYFAHSTDHFQTLSGTMTDPWDVVAASTLPEYYIETRVAVDSSDAAWVVFHARSGAVDAEVLSRPNAGAWQQGRPGWGEPWHEEIVVDPGDVLHVFLQQETSVANPQEGTASAPNTSSGLVSVGNWAWSSLPPAATAQTAIATAGSAMRAIWEDPETVTFASRDHDGTAWQIIVPDAVGTVLASATSSGAALRAAPQLVAGTSHLMWRDAVSVSGSLTHTIEYAPFTFCNGVACNLDDACVANACVPR